MAVARAQKARMRALFDALAGDPDLGPTCTCSTRAPSSFPVADVARSRAFFAALGLGFHAGSSDETTACLLVGENASATLLQQERSAEFSRRPAADPTTHALAPFC